MSLHLHAARMSSAFWLEEASRSASASPALSATLTLELGLELELESAWVLLLSLAAGVSRSVPAGGAATAR